MDMEFLDRYQALEMLRLELGRWEKELETREKALAEAERCFLAAVDAWGEEVDLAAAAIRELEPRVAD